MMNDKQLFYLMQIAGGTFPSGGFSQSWGLETYVANGKVSDEASQAYRLATDGDNRKIEELEDLSRAVKVTKEGRESSLRMGKAFMRIMADITDDEKLTEIKDMCGPEGITYPVIYGLVCGRLGLDIGESMKAFVFSTVNALVQSAVKLVPLGNKQAQRILLELHPLMEATVEAGMETPLEDISNFCPGLDIAGRLHEYLTTRLYMS